MTPSQTFSRSSRLLQQIYLDIQEVASLAGVVIESPGRSNESPRPAIYPSPPTSVSSSSTFPKPVLTSHYTSVDTRSRTRLLPDDLGQVLDSPLHVLAHDKVDSAPRTEINASGSRNGNNAMKHGESQEKTIPLEMYFSFGEWARPVLGLAR
jgi:hypothetical protein